MIATTLFYLLGAIMIVTTLLAIIQRNAVHAVLYVVNSFFALALMFYLLGAPLVAAWEVIVYAGAIMVLFLFVIMILEVSPAHGDSPMAPLLQQWIPMFLVAAVLAVCTLLLTGVDATTTQGIPRWHATPRDFGYALFKEYALAVEIASFQLLFAVVGAFYIARPARTNELEVDK